MKRKFKSSQYDAKLDRAYLTKWMRGEITTMTAIRLMSEHNGWEDMTIDEFIEMANSLGYFKVMRHNRIYD